jgi:hypothetical protein
LKIESRVSVLIESSTNSSSKGDFEFSLETIKNV